MVNDIIWWLVGFAVPGLLFYFLARKDVLDSAKYAGLYAITTFGTGIAVGILLMLFSKESLTSKVFGILLAGSFAVNFAAAYIIQKYSVKYRTPKWYMIPIIKTLVSVLGVIGMVSQLDLFSAMWVGR